MHGTAKIESLYQHILPSMMAGVLHSHLRVGSPQVLLRFSQSHPIRAGGTHPFGIPGISPSLMKGLG